MNPNPFITNEAPCLIAGPCSVESRQQLQSSVESLIQIPEVKLIRCGVWKPRTRPGGFEGLGEPALRWMQELQEQYSPKARFCCEVARPEHVELCLKYGINVAWIGARTSGDPFSVNEIAQALQGASMSVMVKNPLTPDVRLWMGAIERIQQAGIAHTAAIHRGFYIFNDNSPYRNNPIWEIPIELRRLMPQLPILCDPSHIGGKRDFIQQLMQTATDLGTDGYMVEVHPNPDEALTDGQQQITSTQLQQILACIVHRRHSDTTEELTALRQQIDQIDNTLLQQLAQRMQVIQKIADVKLAKGIAIYQPHRMEQILEQLSEKSNILGLDASFVKGLYEKVHAESVRIQEKHINN